MNAGKAHSVGMPDDICESDGAGPALGRIHEVACPGIIAHIGFATKPDIESVQCVIQQRDIYSNNFKNRNKRKSSKKVYLVGISPRAVGGKCVGNKVLKQECANGNNAAQGMQAAQEERVAFTGTNRRDSALDRRGNTSHVLLCSDQIFEAYSIL